MPTRPAGLPPWLTVALAALGAFALAALAAALADALDDTVREEADVERGLGLALLGALPDARRARVPGAHMSPVTHPEAVAEVLARFWEIEIYG